jgi:autotransporter-associated beta strand protein
MKPTIRPQFFRTNRLFVAATLGTLAPLAQAGTIWDGGGANTNIDTVANWDGDALPSSLTDGTQTLTFATAGSSATINTAVSVAGININRDANFGIANGAGSLTIGTGGITVTPGSATARVHTISESSVILGGNQTWEISNTGLSSGTMRLDVTGAISGNYGILKTGAGTLRLTNNTNSFTGDITVQTGILDAHRGSLGTTAGKTYVNSTGSTSTGGQLSINQNGVLYDEAESVVIQGTGSPANGTGTAALRFGGSAGSATTFSNMNGAITLDGNANYKIDVYLQPTHWKINGGIARTGTNTGTLFLDLNHYQVATPVRLTINSTIDNNGGAVTLLGNSAGILQMDTAGHDIGAFTINGEYAPTYQTILKLGISNALATNQNLTITKGTFDLGGFNQTVNALSGVASVSLITNSGSADSKLTIGNGGGGATFAGVIQDGATHKTALEKTGIGTATLTGANTYAGATTITGGTLAISGAGAIANSPTIIVGASTTFNVSAVTGGYTLGAGQTLSGTGTVSGAMTVAGTLSPGNSPGSITTGNQTWVDGGDYNFQMLDAEGVAGTGFDQIQITGTLNLSSLTAGGFNINLWSLSSVGPDENGNALNFDNTIDQSWTILTTSGGITGFDAADFVINVVANNGTAGFSNALGGGSFSLGTASNNLVLNFTAVPEPGAALLGGLGLLALLRRRR